MHFAESWLPLGDSQSRHSWLTVADIIRHAKQPPRKGHLMMPLVGGTEQVLSCSRCRATWPSCSGLARRGAPQHLCAALQVIDQVVQTCPIDCRRALYGNVVLSVSLSVIRLLWRNQRNNPQAHKAKTAALSCCFCRPSFAAHQCEDGPYPEHDLCPA